MLCVKTIFCNNISVNRLFPILFAFESITQIFYIFTMFFIESKCIFFGNIFFTALIALSHYIYFHLYPPALGLTPLHTAEILCI